MALLAVLAIAFAPGLAGAPAGEAPGDPSRSIGAPAPGGRRITAVVVEGARDAAAQQAARDVFGMKAGDTLDAGRVRLGIKRVFLTGPWADVEVSVARAAPGPGVVVFVKLVPDVLIADVSIQAPSRLPRERLRDAAAIDVGERFRPERVDEAAARIRIAMADLGYPRAEVKVDVDDSGDYARRLRFVVDPGEPVRLRKLVVDGDPALSRRDVEALLGVTEGEPFDRPRLEVGLERIKALLMRRRHLGAKVGVVRVTHDAGHLGEGAEVVVSIDAGPRYRLRYVGNHALSDAALRAVLDEGKIESIDALGVARARSAIEQRYRENGYARVSVKVDDVPAQRPYDRDAERELRFVIDEGPRAEVTDVLIEGAKARKSQELEDEVWKSVNADAPDPGLLQPVDPGDVDDLLSRPTGKERSAAGPRPFEVSDEYLELLPRPLIGRKPVYIESAFVEAGRRIADIYRSDGFLDVSVKGPFADFSEDGRKIKVRYTIREGPRVTVSAVRFVDARPCAANASCAQNISFSELLDQVTLAPGQAASFAAVAESRGTLERNLQDKGYPFARVTEGLERVKARADEVDVVYTVNPGPRVAIGKVRTRGNRVTRDMVILDRVTLKPNDLYSASEVERSRERLARMGLFSSVSIELLDDDPTAPVRDLLVVVKERPQFAVEVGAGASVEDGPRAFLAGEVRNIFGLGVGVRGRGQLNYPRAFYDFLYDPEDPNNPLLRFPTTGDFLVDWGQFFEGQAVLTGELPKVYGVPFDTRLHVDTAALRQIRPAFTLNRASVLGGFDMQPFSWLQVGPQIEGEYSDFDCPKDLNLGQSCGEGTAGITRRLDAGFIRQTTYRITGAVDLRDNPVRPRSGVWFSGTTDVALGSGRLRENGNATQAADVNSDFVKLTGAAAGYVPLSPTFIWAVSGRVGNIFPLDQQEYVPLFKRFYLGGTNSIRGFREDEILPADNCAFPATSQVPLTAVPTGCTATSQSLGGNFVMSLRSEIRVTVVGDLEMGTFVDVGQLVEDVADVAPTGFAAGAGVGVRYNTPVGPFAIDLGWKVIDGRRRLPSLSSLDRLNLHLSIGYF